MRFTMYDGFTELTRSRGIEQAAVYAVEHGFSAVEFLGTLTPPVANVAEAREARRVLEAYGLSVSCYSVGTTLFEAPAEEERLLHHAELAAALGSPYLHHTLYCSLTRSPDAPDYEAVFADVTPRALRIVRYAEALGLTCLYEEQGFYFNGIHRFGRFFRGMQAQARNVGVCADLGNILFADEAPEDFVRMFADDIRHVHIKDYRRSYQPPTDGSSAFRSANGAYLTECAVGDGDAQVAACLSVLRNAGYTGQYALEIGFRFPHPYEEIAEQDMAYLLHI